MPDQVTSTRHVLMPDMPADKQQMLQAHPRSALPHTMGQPCAMEARLHMAVMVPLWLAIAQCQSHPCLGQSLHSPVKRHAMG